MNIFTVSIGKNYYPQSDRLKRSIGRSITIFNEDNKLYKCKHNNQIINALYHKCNFANYIQNIDGPIIFLDADIFSLHNDPLKSLNINDDTDIAYVPYRGFKMSFPDNYRQKAFDYHGHKINSGFLYFKNLKIAKDVCTNWVNNFVNKSIIHYNETGSNEYDEYALMIALIDTKYKIELLDNKWNDWEFLQRDYNKTTEEIKQSGSIFLQSHYYMDIV